jgi:4-hydroxyphenylacetate 3-monooxygenase
VKDVYIKLEKETDAGIIVSGAKVVATNSALTHYNMIGFGSAQVMGENPDFALMFVAPMDAEGVKLISRASYEMVAGAPDRRTTTRSPAASTKTMRSW